MAINWGNVLREAGDTLNPFNGDTDYDLSSTYTTTGRKGQKQLNSAADVARAEGVTVPYLMPLAPLAQSNQGSQVNAGGGGGGGGDNSPKDTGDGTGGGSVQVDPMVALRARQAAQAASIRDRLLGRGSEVDDILTSILSAIDTALGDTKHRRQEKFDRDTAALLESFGAATPEVEKAFASLGLSNSTFVGDRLKDVRDNYEASQDDAERQYEDDLAGFGSVAEQNRASAKAQASKAKNKIDYVRDADASADNLQNFQSAENGFNDMLTDFGTEKAKFGTQGDFIKSLEGIGSDYDFGKTLDAFTNFAGSAAAINNPNGAARVKDKLSGVLDKDKKKLTEVQLNNPVGAASA